MFSDRLMIGRPVSRMPRNARRFSGSFTSTVGAEQLTREAVELAAISELLVSVSGTPEFSAVDTAR